MIQPGLERIGLLLKDVNFPWKAVHVAGTNGKGSICNYASTLLTRRCIRNGRFTSPHLIDRWDCININNEPVSETLFRRVEKRFIQLNEREHIQASEFELLTATAFQIFNDSKVEVGVVEVGMGGKLDATNFLNNQAVSVISKIALEHQNFLGSTLEEIAQHKAGILRRNVPYIVNPTNEWNVHRVIDNYAKEIGAGPRIYTDTDELKMNTFSTKEWHKCARHLTPIQRDNVVLAYLAFLEVLKSEKHSTLKATKFLPPLRNTILSGRFRKSYIGTPVFRDSQKKMVIFDGAHNPDGAEALEEYVYAQVRSTRRAVPGGGIPPRGWPVTWVVAMSDGKDARAFLERILRPGDNLITTVFGPVDGMPWVKPMDPKELLKVGLDIDPSIVGLHIPVPGAYRALCAAKYLAAEEHTIAFTGSLYLIGDHYRERRAWQESPDPEGAKIAAMDREERNRVNDFLTRKLGEMDRSLSPRAETTTSQRSGETERMRLQDEMEKLERELQFLEVEENRIKRTRSLKFDTPVVPGGNPPLPNISTPTAATPAESTSLKQKFLEDFERIRTQLAQLPPAPEPTIKTATPPGKKKPTDFRDAVRKAEQRASVNKILENAEEPRIRAHFAKEKSFREIPNRGGDSFSPAHDPFDNAYGFGRDEQREPRIRQVNQSNFQTGDYTPPVRKDDERGFTIRRYRSKAVMRD